MADPHIMSHPKQLSRVLISQQFRYTAWLWSFSSPVMSIYVIDRSRGRKVVSDTLGKSYSGVLHTDFYGSYNEIMCAKQKCWAHLLRELRGLKKKHPQNFEIQYFSSRLKRFFQRAVALRDQKVAGEQVAKALH